MLILTASAVLGDDPALIDARSFLAHIKVLAADDLQGRGNGSEGLERAAEYIARSFQQTRLQPGGDRQTYFQPFEIVTGVGVDGENSLIVSMQEHPASLRLGVDYFPISFTSIRSGTGVQESVPVVFAGYGISAASLGYDDYADIDVTGKAVLIFTHEPQEADAASVFEGKANTTHSAMMQKAMVARSHHASLLMVVEDPTHPDDPATVTRWMKDPQAEEYGIPVVRLSRDRLRHALGTTLDLDATAKAIDGDLKPRSRQISGATVRYSEHLKKVRRKVRNVIGVLPGQDPARAREAIVIGAHYDHLGLGGRNSLRDDAYGQIHNGADDNASGTAAILEIARAAAGMRREFPRTLVFVAFAGEELGLLGSAHYVEHPTVPLDRTVAMINLDMVGRPNGRILVSGLDTTPALEADLEAALAGTGLDFKPFREGAGVGSSDDTTFVLRRVPSIGFFTGFHSDYHRPTDDWEKIDAEGGTAVARLALALARRIANRRDRTTLTVAEPASHTSAPTGSSGAGGGYGPYFGSVPDFGDDQEGVRFAEIREGSPAHKAGFRRGDVLVSFDGTRIKTLYDFTFALRNKRPGDAVEVIVMRDGQEVKAMVELGNRP